MTEPGVLVIDHQDSYTYNLVQLISVITGREPDVVAHTLIDDALLHQVRTGAYSHLVLSPGPGTPENPADWATAEAVYAAHNIPVLGVCLGLQGMAMMLGAKIQRMPTPQHGQVAEIRHSGEGIYAGVDSPAHGVRYHSLHATDLPSHRARVHATSPDDVVMAFNVLSDHGNPTDHWAVQYHPESVLTGHGEHLLRNFLALGACPQGLKNATGAPKAPKVTATTEATNAESLPLYYRRLDGPLDAQATMEALSESVGLTVTAGTVATPGAAVWLDAARTFDAQSHSFSVMAVHTGRLSQVVRWEAATATLKISDAHGERAETGDLLDYLDEHQLIPSTKLPDRAPRASFNGGWLGYLGYEARHALLPEAGISRHVTTLPDGYWLRPQSFIVFTQHAVHLYAWGDQALLEELEQHLKFHSASDGATSELTAAPPEASSSTELAGSWQLSDEQYLTAIRQAQEYLRAGESYEICLTDTYRLTAAEVAGLELYQRLRSVNPAPYAAYLRFTTFGDDLEILSSSPERFLTISAEADQRTIESKPIKGTVARREDPVEDARTAAALAEDSKTRAENLMIVDLLRNDLGKVCVPGSVRVPKLMNIETYATVHQLVSTVRGTMDPAATVADVLRATFPGGSMTGAPKVRTLKLIDQLEASARGVYSGAIGWIGGNRTADLSVVIRTIVRFGEELSVGAGGAIVIDSDPEAELAERNLKARVLLNLLSEALA